MQLLRNFLLVVPILAVTSARDVSLSSAFFPEDLEDESRNDSPEKSSDADAALMELRSFMRAGGGRRIEANAIGSMTKGFRTPYWSADQNNRIGNRKVKETMGVKTMKAEKKGNTRKLGEGKKKQIPREGTLQNEPKHQVVSYGVGARKKLTDPVQSARKGVEERQVNVIARQKVMSAPLESIPEEEDRLNLPSFDFIVGGFPKCGTTTLLKSFSAHPETDMAASEVCSIASPGQADAVVLRKLDETISILSTDPDVKRSFKCPTAMYNYKTIIRMEKHSPNAKFIVGVRHPIKMLQSFYNYRVTEIYERHLNDVELIPHLTDIAESGIPWKGVSLASVQFELFLMQLGKTDVSQENLRELTKHNYELAIKPSNFTIFLYTVDQLEDTDERRSEALRSDLQNYLGLKQRIHPFGHENKNHAIGGNGHKESINICDDEFAMIRKTVVDQGVKTAQWLRDYFIESSDVIVANKKHLIETLGSWGDDPCGKTY